MSSRSWRLCNREGEGMANGTSHVLIFLSSSWFLMGTGCLYPSDWKVEVIASPFQTNIGNPSLSGGRVEVIFEKVNSNCVLRKGGGDRCFSHLHVRIGMARQQVHRSAVIRWGSEGINPSSLLVKHNN